MLFETIKRLVIREAAKKIMERIFKPTDAVLLIGNGDLTASVALCLLNAGHQLCLYTKNEASFTQLFKMHVASQKKNNYQACNLKALQVTDTLPDHIDVRLVIALTEEDLDAKQALLMNLENKIAQDVPIAINSESISVDVLQTFSKHQVIGLNWTEPAHTTFFLEIISTEQSAVLAGTLLSFAKTNWGKDPVVVQGSGIRSRLISAMAREASFLIDNGYASVEDIDRACRNDAGYYLPFSGNCRYMDLMGTYAYGMVMKDLNPDLSKDQEIPEFFKKILAEGGRGIENKKGFYAYSSASVNNWRRTMEKFSYQIQDIIEKYPFNYNKESITD